MKNIGKKFVLVLFVVVDLFMISGCGKKEDKISIVGSWKRDGYVYTFKKDGTGYYEASGKKMNFTYSDKEDKVSILYNGNVEASELKYHIENDKLIIKNRNGKDVEYIKQ